MRQGIRWPEQLFVRGSGPDRGYRAGSQTHHSGVEPADRSREPAPCRERCRRSLEDYRFGSALVRLARYPAGPDHLDQAAPLRLPETKTVTGRPSHSALISAVAVVKVHPSVVVAPADQSRVVRSGEPPCNWRRTCRTVAAERR